MQFLGKIYRLVLQAVRHNSSDADSRARAFARKLAELGIAQPRQLVGCSPAQIVALEKVYGRFPESYRALLRVMGRQAGFLVDRNELWLFADQLERINAAGRQSISDWAEDGVTLDVPDNAVFISARYGDHPRFIQTGKSADSPVWGINGDQGTVTKLQDSVWDFFESFTAEGLRLPAKRGGR